LGWQHLQSKPKLNQAGVGIRDFFFGPNVFGLHLYLVGFGQTVNKLTKHDNFQNG